MVAGDLSMRRLEQSILFYDRENDPAIGDYKTYTNVYALSCLRVPSYETC
jgi:hypothetical protein